MFSTSLSFYHPFITGVLHGGSTWWFVKDSFHSSIVLQDFLSKLWPAKLYSKVNMVLKTCFVLRSSSILHLASQSAILSTLSFEVVLCHSWQFPSCFMIHMLSRMRYFKSINLFVGVILGYISPKAFHWECCYLWCVSMIQVISLSWWRSFHLLVGLNPINCFR